MDYKFPENFLWGSATSGPQSEGAANIDGRSPSVWDYWYSREPERFFDNVGPQDTSTFYKNYKSDIALLKATGHNSFRTSIQWTRLLPDGKSINEKAVEFYNNVIDELINAGIKPIICLHHFDMPMWAYDIGGWENHDVVNMFAFYAKTCFELFADRVELWTTHNEPMAVVENGYLGDYHLPGVVDPKRAAVAVFHSQLASSMAIKELRALKDAGKVPDQTKIGIVLNLTPTYPRDKQNAEDVAAANYCDLFFNRSFLDPSVLGRYPQELIDVLRENDAVPAHTDEELQIIADNTVDFLGVNYYQPRRAKAPSQNCTEFLPEKFYEPYQWPEAKMNPYRGWEIYEKGIYDLAMSVVNNYNNIPFYVSENGMGVEGEERYMDENGKVDDQYRIEFIKDHLRWLHKAMDEGANCFGYHLWTFIDCWSWVNAYKNRYGFVGLDLATQKRTIKSSGEWFALMTSNNGF